MPPSLNPRNLVPCGVIVRLDTSKALDIECQLAIPVVNTENKDQTDLWVPEDKEAVRLRLKLNGIVVGPDWRENKA